MTSVPTVEVGNGHQIVATGAINVALRKTGKAIPYFTAGAGVSSLVWDFSARGSGGWLPICFGRRHARSRDRLGDRALHRCRPRDGWSARGRTQVHDVAPNRLALRLPNDLVPNKSGTFLNSNPVVSTLSPAGSGASATTPGIQFSNDSSFGLESSLSGPAIADFRTFTGSGMQRYDRLTMGMFWRF